LAMTTIVPAFQSAKECPAPMCWVLQAATIPADLPHLPESSSSDFSDNGFTFTGNNYNNNAGTISLTGGTGSFF